jgi:hypothetical protein
MKRLAILSMTFLFVLSVLVGQAIKAENPQTKETKKEQKSEKKALKRLEGNKVSEIAKDNFKTDFGAIPDVQWKRAGTFDEAVFTKNGKQMKAYYDIEGMLVGTTEPVTFAEVPMKGQQEIKTKYKDYTVGPVIFFDDNEKNETDMILYGVQFDDEDNWLVELIKGTKKIVVKVDKTGLVTFFKEL